MHAKGAVGDISPENPAHVKLPSNALLVEMGGPASIS
jgi:hypothetical protein